MKKYTISTIYRGQQITKQVCAKNVKDASEKLEVSTYEIRKYAGVIKTNEIFEGVIAYFDSGNLFESKRDLIRKKMQLEELTAIIDKYQYEKYNKLKKDITL